MNRILLITVFILGLNTLNAQQNEYNCKLLEIIIKDINHEREKNSLLKKVNDIHIAYSSDDGSKQVIYDNKIYSKENVDSIIDLLDSFEVLNNDILSFGDTLQIVDSLSFFTARCSIQYKNLKVNVNNSIISHNLKSYWYLYSVGSHDNFFIVTFSFPGTFWFLNYYFSLGPNEMVLVKKKMFEAHR